MNKRRIILILLFICLTILSLFIGVYSDVTIGNLLNGNKEAWSVFFRSRVPRTLVIIITSSSLSIAGLIMQSLSRNKFISPQTAGTNNASALGVLLSFILLGNQGMITKFYFAFIFACLSSLIFVFLLSKIKFKNQVYIPLIGLMYGGLISAITSFIAYETNTLQLLSSLNLGTFSNIGIINGSLILLVIPALVLALIYSAKFSIVALGEDFSVNLGIKYKTVLTVGIIVSSIIAASSFIVVGPIPFIGLIIPNVVSLYYGDNLKKNIFDIAMFGSIFVLANDILSRIIIYPFEMSVGFTMGITGAITFIFLIFRMEKKNG